MDVSRNEESHVSVTTSLFMALVKVAHDCAKVAAAICVNGKKWE